MPWRTLELSESWWGITHYVYNYNRNVCTRKVSDSLGLGERPENNRVSTHSERLGESEETTAAVFWPCMIPVNVQHR